MASIYEAEVRRKRWVKTVEDQLTARVFGLLELLSKENQEEAICSFIRQLARNRTYGDEDDEAISVMADLKTEDINTSITLWGATGGTYPDVRIETGKGVILIEVKTNTEADKDELVRHIQAASRKEDGGKLLAYFLLTKGYERPEAIQQAQNELRHASTRDIAIHWRRWSNIWRWFKDERDRSRGISQSLLEATIQLMEVESMAGPTGFKEEWSDVRRAYVKTKSVFDQIRRTMEEVRYELEKIGIVYLPDGPDLGKNCDLMPGWPSYYFKDSRWKRCLNTDKDPRLEISFNLEGPEDLGVSVGIWWGISAEDGRNAKVHAIMNERKQLGDLAAASDEEGIWINNSPEDEELREGDNAVTSLVRRTQELRAFANATETLRKATGYRSPRKRGCSMAPTER